jgi:hypothetical protein
MCVPTAQPPEELSCLLMLMGDDSDVDVMRKLNFDIKKENQFNGEVEKLEQINSKIKVRPEFVNDYRGVNGQSLGSKNGLN